MKNVHLSFLVLLPIMLGSMAILAPYKTPFALKRRALEQPWNLEGAPGVGVGLEFLLLFGVIILVWGIFWEYRNRRKIHPAIILVTLISHTIGLILAFASLYRWYGLEDLPAPLDRETAIYFSVVTWTTLGYGDLKPLEEIRLLAALEAFLGYIYLGLIVGITINAGSASVKRDEQ